MFSGGDFLLTIWQLLFFSFFPFLKISSDAALWLTEMSHILVLLIILLITYLE